MRTQAAAQPCADTQLRTVVAHLTSLTQCPFCIDAGHAVCLFVQDHDVYKKRLQADGTPIDEGIKHTIGPENLDLMSKDNVDENGTACGSCYGAHTPSQPCCNTCDEASALTPQALGPAALTEAPCITLLAR